MWANDTDFPEMIAKVDGEVEGHFDSIAAGATVQFSYDLTLPDAGPFTMPPVKVSYQLLANDAKLQVRGGGRGVAPCRVLSTGGCLMGNHSAAVAGALQRVRPFWPASGVGRQHARWAQLLACGAQHSLRIRSAAVAQAVGAACGSGGRGSCRGLDKAESASRMFPTLDGSIQQALATAMPQRARGACSTTLVYHPHLATASATRGALQQWHGGTSASPQEQPGTPRGSPACLAAGRLATAARSRTQAAGPLARCALCAPAPQTTKTSVTQFYVVTFTQHLQLRALEWVSLRRQGGGQRPLVAGVLVRLGCVAGRCAVARGTTCPSRAAHMHQLGPRALCRGSACNLAWRTPSLQQCSIGARALQGGKLTLGYISTVNQWMRTFYITGGATAVWFGLKTYRSIKGGCWQPAVGECRIARRRAGLQCGSFPSKRLTHHAVLGAGVEGRIRSVGWCPMSL